MCGGDCPTTSRAASPVPQVGKPEVRHTATLKAPELEELISAWREPLEANYEEVSCQVVKCPDLTELGLAAPGLGGQADILDCGTVLCSMFNPEKQGDVFDLADCMKAVGRTDGFCVGSGAGSLKECGCNSEWACNCFFSGGEVHNHSYNAWVSDMSRLPEVRTVAKAKSTEFGCIGNVLLTSGEAAGDVVEVRARVRRADKNWSEDPHDQEFVRILRKATEARWPGASDQVAVGGVVFVNAGRTVTHVMPPYFPPEGAKPGKSWPDMKGWGERFFVSEKQLVGLTTFLNHSGEGLPKGLQWRPDHTHFFSRDGSEAGHYHYDIQPEVIEYVAYLVPATRLHKLELGATQKLQRRPSLQQIVAEELPAVRG
eukprot:TRINITY_DN8531_c0_g1_i1.p2 TRINITY_DN8531_c0_g1~~TRINITY_DN8531_c0_g1_i1.p2  ORF type:complete len:371 (+),score=139.73 TRINITY_DN8531_c0_g1_i1:84-1196(+)